MSGRCDGRVCETMLIDGTLAHVFPEEPCWWGNECTRQRTYDHAMRRDVSPFSPLEYMRTHRACSIVSRARKASSLEGWEYLVHLEHTALVSWFRMRARRDIDLMNTAKAF